jgi:hypothetical protein
MSREQRIGDDVVQHPGQFAPVPAVRRHGLGEAQFRVDGRAAQYLFQAIAEGQVVDIGGGRVDVPVLPKIAYRHRL